MKQIKKKTLSFSVNALNIFLDINENVKVEDSKHIDNISVKTIEDLDKIDIFKEYFPDIKDKMLSDIDGLDLIINVTNDINKKNEEKNTSYEKTFKPKKIIITNVLIGVCILIFLSMMFYDKGELTNKTLLLFGANFAPAIKYNIINIYRFITSAFLHASILHLLCNMYSLYILGTQVETFLGKRKFAFIYFISAITGSLASFVFSGNVIAVGASGAIFGLMGSMLYFALNQRTYMGEALKDWKACADLVRTISHKYRIPFFTISPTYSICKIHGYLTGQQFECPKCKAEKEKALKEKLKALESEKEKILAEDKKK